MTAGQVITKAVYEDPIVVQAFQKGYHKALELLEAFAWSLPGLRLLDLGCGTGTDTFQFAELGLQSTGIDYSEAMIEAARAASTGPNPPHFQAMDMRAVGEAFPAGSFDGAWVCASLLHIPELEVPGVLAGLRRVLTVGGRAMISLKGGPQGAALVTEHKHGRVLQREFVFWERAPFEAALEQGGFRVVGFEATTQGTTGGQPTQWLRFTAEAEERA